MIRLKSVRFPAEHRNSLAKFQQYVDAGVDYADRVQRAKDEFGRRNKATNATFAAVRASLDRMCSGARRCCYCEDSAADEVEHFRPKDLYPAVAFQWANYLYACGPCNGPKNNHFAIISRGGVLKDVTRKPKDPVVPPIKGRPALIDPRSDDPLQFMTLDLVDTFWFVPSGAPGSEERARAEYTIDVLHLNDRDVLPRARKESFEDYVAHVVRYRAERDSGTASKVLQEYVENLRLKQHPTVWAEMKRQHARHARLAPVFAAVPEALGW